MWDKQSRFTAMVNALSGELYRYAYWLSGSRAEAEDLVQETYERAWRSLGQLRDDGAAKGWLFTTLRREHARLYERQRPELSKVEIDDVADRRRDFDDSTEAHVLRVALGRLAAEYREPLVLQVVGGFNGEEIAGMLGLNVNTVNVRLFRARQRLREQLGGRDSSLEMEMEMQQP